MESFDSIPLSKHGQREMSVFIANELLYDFLKGTLDEDRKQAIHVVIDQSPDLQNELIKIQNGIRYAQALAQLRIDSSNLEKIDQPETYLSVLFKKTNYDRWPLSIRWGLEAGIVLLFFLSVLIVVPWNRILNYGLSQQGRELILAEIAKTKNPSLDEGITVAHDDSASFEDEGVKESTATAAAPITASPTMTPEAPSPGSAPSPTPAPGAAPVSPPAVAAKEDGSGPVGPERPEPVLQPPLFARQTMDFLSVPPAAPLKDNRASVPASAGKPKAVAARNESVPSEAQPQAAEKKPAEGFLYRGVLKVTNLEATGPKLAEKIEELGGRKAGQVELGWRKTPTSSYFHFTMPEAKYEELIVFLSDYGDPQILKEKHPRVMPEGIVRLIIEVEEANP